MKLRQRLGAMLLIGVMAAVVIAYSGVLDWFDNDGDSDTPRDLTVVRGYGGELKVNFINDPDVSRILSEKYGLKVEITKAGSIQMLCDLPLEDKDFIWAGDQSSLSIYRDCGGIMVRSDNVYNSPLVLYSWAPIVDALVANGIAQPETGGAYSIDFTQFVGLMAEGATWEDIGLPDLHGKITMHTTDPTKSNSGYLFAGLLANSLNRGDVVNATTVQPLLPGIGDVFDRLGYMEETSGDLFEQFLTTGMGAKPIVVGYESQLLEFLLENPSYREQVNAQVRVLYPEPTVWASHPMVARNEKGARLLDALKDPEIQQLAWDKHGQRSGVAGVAIDPASTPIAGLMRNITSVVDMPAPVTMNRILAEIDATPAASNSGRTGLAAANRPPLRPGVVTDRGG